MTAPGFEVYAKTEGPDARCRYDGLPRGGIILEMYTVDYIDGDTGEKEQLLTYRCYDPHSSTPAHQREVTLTEHQIDPDTFQEASYRALRNTMRHLCRQVGQLGTGKDPNGNELDKVTDAARIAAILGQRGYR